MIAGDPWRDIPESERKTVTRRRGNILVTSYVDTLEDLRRSKRISAALPASDAKAAPEKPSRNRSGAVTANRSGWSRLDDADGRDEDHRP